MSSKILVAKSGFNALTETDPNSFIFHSDYNTLKIIHKAQGSFQVINDGVERVASIAHLRSYIPFVFAFAQFSGSRLGLPGSKDPSYDLWFTKLQVDATNMDFYYINNVPSGVDSMTVYYYIVEVPL